MEKITKDILKKVYPVPDKGAQKYDKGLVLVIGGGEFYTGSPALSALAALRSGADMVQVLAPRRAADIIASFSPNLAAYRLKGDWLDEEDLSTLLAMTESAKEVAGQKTALVIGGGLGRSEATKRTVLSFLKRLKVKAVVDADGLHALAQDLASFSGKNFVLTPHSFEFKVLTKTDPKKLSFEERTALVKREAAKIGCVILLKGEKDIISDGKEVAVNTTGSPFMTVGGTGDTLSGICGSLLAQGVEPLMAAKAAAFINGKAGEAAARKFGQGLLATDLIKEIPKIIK